jgi:anti-anti-sigma regulatory factor
MTSGVSFGDARDVDGGIFVPVKGKIDISTMDDFKTRIGSFIRQPGKLAMDFSEVTAMDGKGVMLILQLRQNYPRCEIKLVNVSRSLKHKFENYHLAACGVEIKYQTEVA